MLSRSLLQEGKVDEARTAIANAVRLSERSRNVIVGISVMLDHAYVLAAGNDLRGAEKAAQQALSQTRRLGLFRLQLEASLALSQIETQAKNPAPARAR